MNMWQREAILVKAFLSGQVPSYQDYQGVGLLFSVQLPQALLGYVWGRDSLAQGDEHIGLLTHF